MKLEMLKSKKNLVLLVSLLLLLTVLATGTVAYLFMQSDAVTNTFTIQTVVNDIVEAEFNTEVKQDVTIKNAGTATSYIRAAVIVTWKTEEGNNVSSKLPVAGEDYTMTMGDSANWVPGADGYYYYTSPVDAGNSTDVLITSCTPTLNNSNQPVGHYLSVEIISQSIQAGGLGEVDGVDGSEEKQPPVLIAWGTPNGSVGAVDDTTGNLTIVKEAVSE